MSRRRTRTVSGQAARKVSPSTTLMTRHSRRSCAGAGVGLTTRRHPTASSRRAAAAGRLLVTAHTVERDAQPARPAVRRDDPGAYLPRRVVPHVLAMATVKLGHPVTLLILMEAGDVSAHGGWLPS